MHTRTSKTTEPGHLPIKMKLLTVLPTLLTEENTSKILCCLSKEAGHPELQPFPAWLPVWCCCGHKLVGDFVTLWRGGGCWATQADEARALTNDNSSSQDKWKLPHRCLILDWHWSPWGFLSNRYGVAPSWPIHHPQGSPLMPGHGEQSHWGVCSKNVTMFYCPTRPIVQLSAGVPVLAKLLKI